MVHEPFEKGHKTCPACGSSNIDLAEEGHHICCLDCGYENCMRRR